MIEVKGGGIARDGRSGKWTSTDRLGAARDIQDPVAQARRSHYALRDKLRSLPGWDRREVLIGHGVAFPDSKAETSFLGSDMPRDLVILSDDLQWIDRKIESMLRYCAGQHGETPLDSPALHALEKLLAPSFELRQCLGLRLREEEREILRLTQEQFALLDMLNRNRRVKIRGGAGTGKTLLALEKATRLAREGYRTLLTCFNRPLALHLKASVTDVGGLTIDTFHQLCGDMAKRIGIPVPEPDPSRKLSQEEAKQLFGELLPSAFERALDELPDERFDAIIVDEGQDFEESWWLPLQLALRDPDDGILYVFYDDNQRIYKREVKLPEDLVPFDLTRNLRNTQSIQRIANRFYGGEVQPIGPKGQPVELIAGSGSQVVRKNVSRILHRLVSEESVPLQDIVVLTGRSPDKSALGSDPTIGAFTLTRDHYEIGKVLLESVHRFKGLERPVVILIEIDGYVKQDRPEILYVGLTRARLHLVVVAAESTIDILRSSSSC